jgi:alpha-glucosidase
VTRWWRDAVGYEVYVRSFADDDGDGVGDLPGIVARLDHLADLGVDIVWVTPFYPSPMLDHGYDVADYTDVAAELGSLADADALVAGAHDRGMRLLVDLVPNHSSSEHPWFRSARRGRDDPYRDYYVWRDPAPDGGPPNNWRSHFGGPAWTLDEASGQYWLHLFLPEQPDLNWANPAVHDEFEAILRFWLERGADGFRIDVAHSLVKHPDLPDDPLAVVSDAYEAGVTADDFEALEHRYDLDQPGVVDVYRRWRRIADEYGALLIGEVYILEASGLDRYLTAEGLHLAFWFAPLHRAWDPAALRAVLREGADLAQRVDGGVGWVQGSHDVSRAVARYGGGQVGRERALAFGVLLSLLPGTPFLYQGEELGVDDPVIRPEDAQDPIAARNGAYDKGRDVARTPMPWAPGPGLGFTSAARAWLPFGDRRPEDTVAVQRADPDSTLSAHRRLLAARRPLLPLPRDVAWLTDDGGVVAYRRGDVVVAANLGDDPEDVDLGGLAGAVVRFGTDVGREGNLAGERLSLAPREAVVVA